MIYNELLKNMMKDDSATINVNKKMGACLKTKREFLSKSIEEVAEYSSTTPGYLGLVELGKRKIRIGVLEKVMEILEMDFNDVFDPEQMALEQKIRSYFEELNIYDLQIILNLCELLRKSKKETNDFKNIRFFNRPTLNKRKKRR